jgi:CBS domain-containing protein
MSTQVTDSGSYLTPRLEHARVSDAMRHGILSCRSDASMRDAARTMALHHVHTIIVSDPRGEAPLGSISDTELVDVLLDKHAEDRPLAEIAQRELLTISADESLIAAARLMRQHHTAHLIVRDPSTQRPVGMLSTLDLAGVLAWGES